MARAVDVWRRVKIVLVNNRDFTVWQFRRGLIKRLLELGHEVLVATPPGEYTPRIEVLGARHLAIPLDQYMDPAGDVRCLAALTRLYRAERVDLAHHITIKPNVLGSFAARLAGVPRTVGLVAGLGHLYNERAGLKPRVVQETATALYRLAFAFNHRVWFQNEDDMSYFVRRRVLPRRKAVLIRGSGVDLTEYSPEAVSQDTLQRLRDGLGIAEGTGVVLMASRAFWSKGVREFVEAAGRVGAGFPVRFILAGASEQSPDTAPPEYLRASESEHFRWIGFRSDVRELLALADVVALPSSYREGVPRVLLEGLAMGKPVVTTDTIGCRETVDEGRNGFLVAPRDGVALATAIERLLRDPALRARFGTHSRIKAEREFDERLVVERVIREVYGIH